MSEPKDLAAPDRPAGSIGSRFTPYSDASPKRAGASAIKGAVGGVARPGVTSERPPWLVFQIALAFAALVVAGYGATTRSWTLLTIEALIGTAALSVGGLLGFLFGIPRTMRPRNSETATSADTRREAAAPYEPSNNLEQVADWLTKILVGVGLVELGKIGNGLAQIGDQVAKSVAPPPAGTNVVTEVILIAFATIGFLASFLWTRIYYGGIQARADSDIVNWLESKLEDQESRIDRADKVAEKLASGKLVPPTTATPPSGMVPVTLEQQAPTGELPASIATDLPENLRAPVDRFLHTGVDWNDDTVTRIFGTHPSEANGRVLNAEISVKYEKALVIRLVVERRGGAPLDGDVTFLLHPTFHSRARIVPVEGDNRADLEIYCTGWFTVGAIADKGQTLLEYDLRMLPGAPEWFKKG
ncbi:MAG TPA: pYEATS domain-containing protein [Gemmatimonadaceae bacterium]|nr:pYEATS domain-containing protein [Gemmatimonadaceae bacterium]